MPKRGKATPRYLLKLQQEVDAMQQIGASFDAVYLRVSPYTVPIVLFIDNDLKCWSGQAFRAAYLCTVW